MHVIRHKADLLFAIAGTINSVIVRHMGMWVLRNSSTYRSKCYAPRNMMCFRE